MSYPRHPATNASLRRSASRCHRSAVSSPTRGRKPTSTDTSHRRGRECDTSLPSSSCRRSDRSHWIVYPRRRSGAGSTHTARPPRAVPTMLSTSCEQIMNFAVACGHIDANPARGVKRNRRSGPYPLPVPRGDRPPPQGPRRPVRREPRRSRLTSFGFCCSPDAAEARSCSCAGRRSETTRSRWPTARPDREMCPSTQGLDASWKGSRNAGARSCFLHRATRPVRAVSTFRYGIGGSVAKSGWLVTCLRDLERGVEA